MSRAILSVEDEQDTSTPPKAVLEREGYLAVRAENGRQAICLNETMLPPAQIALDVVLPYVNGFESLTAFRLNPDWKHVTVIMVSANSCAPGIERAVPQGTTDYVIQTAGDQRAGAQGQTRSVLVRGGCTNDDHAEDEVPSAACGPAENS